MIRSFLLLAVALSACTGNVSVDGGSTGGGGGSDAGTGGGGGTTVTLPSWRRDAGLNQWIEIPNTSGAGGAAIDAWGALAENKATAELYIAASGGHSDSSDNRVVSISLMSDAPSWVLRHASSTSTQPDVLYYADGLPTSRHLYQHLHYSPRATRCCSAVAALVTAEARPRAPAWTSSISRPTSGCRG